MSHKHMKESEPELYAGLLIILEQFASCDILRWLMTSKVSNNMIKELYESIWEQIPSEFRRSTNKTALRACLSILPEAKTALGSFDSLRKLLKEVRSDLRFSRIETLNSDTFRAAIARSSTVRSGRAAQGSALRATSKSLHESKSKALCNTFEANGSCTRTNCRYSHHCSICNKVGHHKSVCRNASKAK